MKQYLILAVELLGRLVNRKLGFCFLFIIQVSCDSGSCTFFWGGGVVSMKGQETQPKVKEMRVP